MTEIITQEEKINYIYETLKKNQRKALWATLFKWGFRIFMIWYMIYFIKVGLPLLIDSLIPNIPSISGEWTTINTDQIKNIMSEYFSK